MEKRAGYKVQKYRVQLVRDGVQRVPLQKVTGEDSAAVVLRDLCGSIPHEEIWVLLMNATHEICGAVRVSQGGHNGAAVLPCDILRPVIASGCNSFIIGHNHPSGDPTPSQSDIEVTGRLLEACSSIGLFLLDHLVVTRGEAFRSLRVCQGLDWE